MPRCLLSLPRMAAALVLGASAWLAAAPAAAQNTLPTALGGQRNFPEAALRGTLVITSATTAEINGQAIRMAPGMRLLNPQNGLVMLHTALGQKHTVNYLIEHSTGMLLTAWILSTDEAAQARAGGVSGHNYRTGADAR
ncbi:MAG: hypothetical protein BGO74_16445 [Burkholderiales bacterium 68-12]|nr:MAG: hypothetical protein BGO74_16445 [Burkholderiales bacterium 68-12]